jgi:hypothetical protein
MILHTFQMTVLHNLRSANTLRAQREEMLTQFVKRKEATQVDDAHSRVTEQSTPTLVRSNCVRSIIF